jgi:hypothetical protein
VKCECVRHGAIGSAVGVCCVHRSDWRSSAAADGDCGGVARRVELGCVVVDVDNSQSDVSSAVKLWTATVGHSDEKSNHGCRFVVERSTKEEDTSSGGGGGGAVCVDRSVEPESVSEATLRDTVNEWEAMNDVSDLLINKR